MWSTGQGVLQRVLHHVKPPASPPAPSCPLQHHLMIIYVGRASPASSPPKDPCRLQPSTPTPSARAPAPARAQPRAFPFPWRWTVLALLLRKAWPGLVWVVTSSRLPLLQQLWLVECTRAFWYRWRCFQMARAQLGSCAPTASTAGMRWRLELILLWSRKKPKQGFFQKSVVTLLG